VAIATQPLMSDPSVNVPPLVLEMIAYPLRVMTSSEPVISELVLLIVVVLVSASAPGPLIVATVEAAIVIPTVAVRLAPVAIVNIGAPGEYAPNDSVETVVGVVVDKVGWLV
jgi:hypothetical protein